MDCIESGCGKDAVLQIAIVGDTNPKPIDDVHTLPMCLPHARVWAYRRFEEIQAGLG